MMILPSTSTASVSSARLVRRPGRRAPLGLALCVLGLLGSSVACSAGGDDDASARPVATTNDRDGTGAGNTTSPGTSASPGTAATSGTSASEGTTNTVPATGTPVGASADDIIGTRPSSSGVASVSGGSSSGSTDGNDESGSVDAGAAPADAGESNTDDVDGAVDEADAGAPDAAAADAGANVAAALGDGQIVTVADVLNASEVEQAQAVLPRLQNDAVRAFAQIMIEEHQAARDGLGTLATEQQIAAANSDVADQLRAQSQQVQSELAAVADAQLDAAYLETQVTAHGEAEALLADLSAAADSPALAAQLSQLRLNVQGHLQSASALRASLQGGAGL